MHARTIRMTAGVRLHQQATGRRGQRGSAANERTTLRTSRRVATTLTSDAGLFMCLQVNTRFASMSVGGFRRGYASAGCQLQLGFPASNYINLILDAQQDQSRLVDVGHLEIETELGPMERLCKMATSSEASLRIPLMMQGPSHVLHHDITMVWGSIRYNNSHILRVRDFKPPRLEPGWTAGRAAAAAAYLSMNKAGSRGGEEEVAHEERRVDESLREEDRERRVQLPRTRPQLLPVVAHVHRGVSRDLLRLRRLLLHGAHGERALHNARRHAGTAVAWGGGGPPASSAPGLGGESLGRGSDGDTLQVGTCAFGIIVHGLVGEACCGMHADTFEQAAGVWYDWCATRQQQHDEDAQTDGTNLAPQIRPPSLNGSTACGTCDRRRCMHAVTNGAARSTRPPRVRGIASPHVRSWKPQPPTLDHTLSKTIVLLTQHTEHAQHGDEGLCRNAEGMLDNAVADSPTTDAA